MLRKLAIRFFLPIAWRLSKKRKAIALEKFSVTEIDSAWQSLYALNSISDGPLKAKLFQHALEELNHGSQFERLFKACSDVPSTGAPFERQALFDPSLGDRALVDFYAYESLGESTITREFIAYASASPDPEVRRTFESLREDELGHTRYTDQVLTELTGGKKWPKTWSSPRPESHGFTRAGSASLKTSGNCRSLSY